MVLFKPDTIFLFSHYKETVMNRNYTIDIIKFVFSIIILLYHFRCIFWGGYLAVEGFFMISGFLMMNTLLSQKKESLLQADSSARFVLRKYSAIFLPLLFSAISGFLIYELLINNSSLQTTIKRIPLLLFEVFPVQVAGFEAYYATGVTWYLSALFLGIAIIHPLAKKDPERFAYTFCPPIIILCYGFLCYRSGKLDLPCTWFSDFINSGMIRGIAGLCMGCLVFVLSKKSADKKQTVLSRIIFSLIALAGWVFFFRYITDFDSVRSSYDFITTAVLFVVLYLELSRKTVLSIIFRHKWTRILSTVSSYIFMNHYAWAQYFINNHPDLTWQQQLPWYLLCVAVSSSAVALLTFLTRMAVKGIKARTLKTTASLP